jgi:hypothetical protein
MPANDERVPKHYRSDGYIHWDLIIETHTEYLAANATKYISRWRKKNGLQDLQKAVHYIDKLIESAKLGFIESPMRVLPEINEPDFAEVAKFCLANNLSEREQIAVTELILWRNTDDLENARDTVNLLIEEAQSKPVPATDSNKHADRAKDPTGW